MHCLLPGSLLRCLHPCAALPAAGALPAACLRCLRPVPRPALNTSASGWPSDQSPAADINRDAGACCLQVNRVLAYALNTKQLKQQLMESSQLVNEANREHARTMNRMLLEAAASKAGR